MASPKIQDEQLLERLTGVFRVYGYEGASLSRIAEATGLQRASLYHRFPGGKEEMAQAVLQRADRWLKHHVLTPLSGPGSPVHRVRRMAERLHEFYMGGSASCLLDTLSLDTEDETLQRHVRSSMKTWLNALTEIAKESGFAPKAARERSEDTLARIEGALVLGRITGNLLPFQRVLRGLPDLLTSNKQVAL